MDKNNRIIVGLTGGIASGKSFATECFKRLGSHVIDADEISKKVTAFGTCGHDQLLKAFPHVAVEGVISRLKLRELVFGDYTELEKLSAIVLPLIASQAEVELRNSPNGVVIFVAPLLFEKGFDSLVDLTVTISCDEHIRIQRLIKRDNIDESLARKMIDAQLSDSEREKKADYIIINEDTEDSLYQKVFELYKIFEKRCLK